MNQQPANTKGFSGKQVLAIVVGVMLLTIVVTIFAVRTWLFPHPFTPVVLDQKEEQRLEQKLERFESVAGVPKPKEPAAIPETTTPKKDFNKKGELSPEPYSEKGASREIHLSEREINGLLAKNTDLARKIAIDLADDRDGEEPP